MDSIIRGLLVYLFVFVIFRVAGKRTLAEATTFDLVLLLIISETTQQAMVSDDHSMTNTVLLVCTLVGADIVLSILKQKFPAVDSILDGQAVILIQDGKVLHDRLERERVDTADILESARLQLGIESLDQVRLAVLERNGRISVIPK